MARKNLTKPFEIKLEGETGKFKAVFSKFNDIDKDNDVTLPGAMPVGKAIKIAYWGHRWKDLPVGKGVIGADENHAWVDGEFFLDTQAGLDTYRTVKNLGNLQEWSYGYEPKKFKLGEFKGQRVRFLEAVDVFEVSPVLVGAGNDTYTDSLKDMGFKPGAEIIGDYIHVRVENPDKFIDDSFRTITIDEKKGIKAIIGKYKDDPQGSTHVQKYIFDKDKWSPNEAEQWVADHKKSIEFTLCDLLYEIGESKVRDKEIIEMIEFCGIPITSVLADGEYTANDLLKDIAESLKQKK